MPSPCHLSKKQALVCRKQEIRGLVLTVGFLTLLAWKLADKCPPFLPFFLSQVLPSRVGGKHLTLRCGSGLDSKRWLQVEGKWI